MDQYQGSSHEEPHVNLLALPTELLVYIISLLSSLSERMKLRHVSRWFKCVIEETPSLWMEFVCDSHEEYSVKELLKVYGQHVKVISFPFSRATSSLLEMLQYCSNVQHLRLPSTKLNPEQLQEIMHNMKCLQSLELKVYHRSDLKQLISATSHLEEITVISIEHFTAQELFLHWKENHFRPSSYNVIITSRLIHSFLWWVTHKLDISPAITGATATFRVYCEYNKTCKPPHFQIQVEASGQLTTPFLKLNEFGIVELQNDLAVMTNCHYGGKTMYRVILVTINCFHFKISNLANIVKPCDLNCITHFELSVRPLHSWALEKLSVACPNLHTLNLADSYHCLRSLQGLRSIANHCHNLQGLNLAGICVERVEDHIRLWEILSHMKLTHLGVECCVFRSETASVEKFIFLLKKCSSTTGIEFENHYYYCEHERLDVSMLSHFASLHYCYLKGCKFFSSQMINECTQLKSLRIIYTQRMSPELAHMQNLQQLYIEALSTLISNEFMTSVSAHGGLVHVVMDVGSLTAEGITSLVRNSPKLITLYLRARIIISVEIFNTTLKKMFTHRRLFTTGYYYLSKYDRSDISPKDVLQEQGTDLLPLWSFKNNT